MVKFSPEWKYLPMCMFPFPNNLQPGLKLAPSPIKIFLFKPKILPFTIIFFPTLLHFK